MLKSVRLKFSNSPSIDMVLNGITVFVGANGSGKSLILREIGNYNNNTTTPNILEDYDIAWPDEDELVELLNLSLVKGSRIPDDDNAMFQITAGNLQSSSRINSVVSKNNLRRAISMKDKVVLSRFLGSSRLLRLDGRSRFNLVNNQPAEDLDEKPKNILQQYFVDDFARTQARLMIKDGVGLNLVIDPTKLGVFRIRLSTENIPDDEQSLKYDNRQFFSRSKLVTEFSDGVQAYVGIILAVIAEKYDTILLDEPEAFLHPPLARKLGRQITRINTNRKANLLIATHSSDFLMGCIEAGARPNIVRLEFQDGKSKGKIIDKNLLSLIVNDPLMRSANVISGLFHDGVVVTESDTDRAFYNEIYARLVNKYPRLPMLLFVNAQNKQTIPRIILALRAFGVPASGITDVDIVKDGGKDWSSWLQAIGIPNLLHGSYGEQRSRIKHCFEQSQKDMKVDGGVYALNNGEFNAANEFFDALERYGLFCVRRGELETWLPNLKVEGRKTAWLTSMLEKLGSDPDSRDYVLPSDGNVWKFIHGICSWTSDPSRKGL